LAAGTSELGSRTIIMVWRSGRDRGNIVAYEHKVRGLCLIIDENPYLKVTIEDRVGAVAADLVEDNFHIDRCVLVCMMPVSLYVDTNLHGHCSLIGFLAILFY
jgi:hypothetical protein